jgi:hypothetical protein
LRKEIEQIQATRTDLETMRMRHASFDKNISALGSIWQHAHNEALEIQQWLDDGAKDAVSHLDPPTTQFRRGLLIMW